MIIRTLLFDNPIAGYPSLIVIILFLGGIQLISLGVIGEYLGRTYAESKQRTLYFTKGFHPSGAFQQRDQDPAQQPPGRRTQASAARQART